MAESLRPREFFPREWREYLNKKEYIEQMSLEEFTSHWKLTHQELAVICECSVSTVDHWFMQGKSCRPPGLHHRRRLAEAYRELNQMVGKWAVGKRCVLPAASSLGLFLARF